LEQAEASVQNSLGYRRVLRDTPRFAAITLVAPGERFNALAILVTPCLSFAIVFNVRTSSFDHARLWHSRPQQKDLAPVLRRPVEPAANSGHSPGILLRQVCFSRQSSAA
jgi:hypothetical protein